MPSSPSATVPWEPVFALPPAPAAAPPRFGLAACVSFLAGFLTPFTVTLIGEMPVGELVLFAAAVWVVVCIAFNHAWPGVLFRRRYLGVLLVCQAVALAAYVASDLYRHSTVHDMARGWARLVFVAIDIVAIAYLFGRSPRNFIWSLCGQMTGAVAAAWLLGALFDDFWKFGIGVPLTYAVVLLAAWLGRVAVIAAALALCGLHFAMDFRSAAGMCLLLAAGTALQLLPVRIRWWALPAGAAATAVLLVAFYIHDRPSAGEHRASRSDIDRSAMMTAAGEAFLASPLIGQGSWFSRSNVYENYLMIRSEAAREAHMGGFAGLNDQDTDQIAFHSQILVALAEGGLFGGTFFFAFGGGLVWALHRLAFGPGWRRTDPAAMLYLLFAVWNLVMSPFSGAHRVYIATSVGLILLLQHDPARAAEDRPA